jgi:hypothetical protein
VASDWLTLNPRPAVVMFFISNWPSLYFNIAMLPSEMPSEQKREHFLTALSKTDITASTRNQACMQFCSFNSAHA